MKFEKLFIPLSIIVAGIIIAGSVMVVGGINPLNPKGWFAPRFPGAETLGAAEEQPEAGNVKVSVDDDPVMGDDSAPVTIIEFSDYECPFCKKAFEDAIPQIKSEYIDKGLVKYVFRDAPLSFHDPLATQEAIAANCAQEQGGDGKYFEYHDAIYDKTKSNGNGLEAPDDLYAIAADLGLDGNRFKECLDSEKYKDEVESDVSDVENIAQSLPRFGTPAFFIGKSSPDGVIDAQAIIGAQPFSAFKSIIDSLL